MRIAAEELHPLSPPLFQYRRVWASQDTHKQLGERCATSLRATRKEKRVEAIGRRAKGTIAYNFFSIKI